MCEQNYNPNDIVEALRRLINCSKTPTGPSKLQSVEAVNGLSLPEGWLDAVLTGWQSYGIRKRIKKQFKKDMTQKTPLRFISINLIPAIDLRKEKPNNNICRLCGMTPDIGHRKWHVDCWAALQPHTSRYWSKIRRNIFDRDDEHCVRCRMNVNSRKWNKQKLREWKRDNNVKGSIYQIDHIVPIVEGGSHTEHNLQLLCTVCHKKKTISESQERLNNKRHPFFVE